MRHKRKWQVGSKNKMKKFLKNLLSKMLITIVALMLVCPKTFADDEQALLTGDIGDFGAWTT